jgi:hypothetical protein
VPKGTQVSLAHPLQWQKPQIFFVVLAHSTDKLAWVPDAGCAKANVKNPKVHTNLL